MVRGHHSSPCRRPTAFTLVELLVAVSIVGLLSAVLLPAVQHVREVARGTACQSHLRQLVISTHGFEAAHSTVPPMDLADCWATWAVLLMPFCEAREHYQNWELEYQYYVQATSAGSDLELFHCPSQLQPRRTRGDSRFFISGGIRTGPAGWSDYAAVRGTSEWSNDGMFRRSVDAKTGKGALVSAASLTARVTDWRACVTFSDLAVDGLAHTLAFGEKQLVPANFDRSVWNGDDQHSYVRSAGRVFPLVNDSRIDAPRQFGGQHPQVCHFGFADGRVNGIGTGVDVDTLHALAAVADGVLVGGD
jgi:prepilin-type N-terminal cleavage/methylation domain-containing protein